MTFAVHSALSGSELHVPGYKQATDPGAVGAGIQWVDTSSGSFLLKSRNASNTGWDVLSGAVTGTFATDFRVSIPFLDGQPFALKITNLTSSVVEPEPESRKRMDLTSFTQVRASVLVESASNLTNPSASVGFQFSLDNGSSWKFLDGLSGPTASLAVTGSNTSGFTTITGSAQTDVLLRWVTLGGDGLSSPVIGTLGIGLRMTQIGLH